QKIVIPIFDALDLGEMLAGVLVGDDFRSDRVEPLVSVGMIEVPMGIDQVCHRLDAEIRQGFGELRARHTNSSIDEHFSVSTRQTGNIAPGALEHAHIPAQLIRRHRRGRRTVLDKGYEPARLSKSLARCKPATRGRKSRTRHAAETKMAARKHMFLSQTYGFLLTVLWSPLAIAREVAPGLGLVSRGETATRGLWRIATRRRCRLGRTFAGLPALWSAL